MDSELNYPLQVEVNWVAAQSTLECFPVFFRAMQVGSGAWNSSFPDMEKLFAKGQVLGKVAFQDLPHLKGFFAAVRAMAALPFQND